MAAEREASFRRAFLWTFILSIVLGWIPVLGPLAAGLCAGRMVRRPQFALLASLIPAVLWAAGLWYLSGRELKFGAQYIVAGPLAFLAPVQAASLLGGALLGSSGGAGKLLGLILVACGLAYGVPKARDIAKVVSDVLAASRVEVYRPAENKTCPEDLKELYKAVQFYADDWDGGLPPADRWMTLIKDKVPKDSWLHCPAVSSGKGAKFGYAMNPDVGGKKLESIQNRAATPLLYDSADVTENAHAGLESVPKPGRHMGRNNVLYADGTVKQQ